MNFDWAFAMETLPQLLGAMRITAQATLTGMILASVLGLVWTVLRRSPSRILATTVYWVVEFIRSTPILVQIYFLYYMLPSIGISLTPFFTGFIALGVHYSAYMAEVYRAGIESVSKGQWEAARALSLSPGQTWRKVVLPQAIPPVIPALGNYLIAMFKDTPMLSAITVLELLGTAKIIGSETFRYLEPLTLVGVLFLVLSLASSYFVRRIEKRLDVEGAAV